MKKLNMQTPNITEQNLEQIAKLFPNVMTETQDENGNIQKAIDFDLLKQSLSDVLVDDADERYRLDWPGKKAALLKANTPITKTLRPCREDSVNFDSTENVYIEGDNFEVLKILQESYLGKIKMIYIDPPYNTGKDFIYKDNFTAKKADYEEETGATDEEDNKLFKNTDTNGRFHSDWLSMMYERLVVARDLLKEDGVIFISIDDNEVHNLKSLCDEILGEENFVNTISVNMKNIAGASGGGEDKKLKKNIEFLLIYVKSYSDFPSFKNVYDYVSIGEIVKNYKDEGKSWKYTSVLIFEGEKEYIGSTVDGDGNEIKIFSRSEPIIKSVNQVIKDEGISEDQVYVKYSKRIFQTAMPQSSIRPRVMEKVQNLGRGEDFYSIEYIPRSGKNKGKIYEQFYKGNSFRLLAWLGDVSEEIDGILYKKELQGTFWDFVGETKNLSKEGEIQFLNGKKPIQMLKRLLSMQSDESGIILDFFSGSASMAHAVISQNIEDQGDRKFILVQLPENIEGNTKENKQYLKYLDQEKLQPIVSEIAKERIRRAGNKIVEDNQDKEGIEQLDIGFRVYKTDTSNMKEVYYHPEQLTQEDIFSLESNIKEGRKPDDLLTQVILDLGLELNLPIEQKEMHGNKVFIVQTNALVACFDDNINIKIIDEIAELKPFKVVFKDASFAASKDRINLEERFKRLSPETLITVI